MTEARRSSQAPQQPSRSKPQSLSVVIPVYNEVQNAEPLVRQTAESLRTVGLPWELITVDDGSQDGTPAALRSLQAEFPELVVVQLGRNFGQTPALQAGLDRARGDVIVTMDGDLQNDPRDIPQLLERIAAGADVVSGWRQGRQDALVLRKIPSWFANRLIRRLTSVPIHDQGCSLKAYRRDVVKRLNLYSDLHRFIIVLTMGVGAVIEEIPVRHHSRAAGQSKYGISRVFKVVVDLLTLQMLTRFQENPTRWFALLGLPFLIGALVTGVAAVFLWSESIVLPTVSFLASLIFASCTLAGLLGEVIIQTASGKTKHRAIYREHGAT